MELIQSRIVSFGHAEPSKTLTNFDLEKIVDTSDEWIKTRTGINQRKIVNYSDKENHLSLSLDSANMAIKRAKLKNSDIDAVIVCTISPDTYMPNASARLCDKLGITCYSFDLSAACAGWLSGCHVAKSLIATGDHKNVLVVGTEILSRGLNWDDRSTCVIFGDGSGACVISAATDDSKILGSCVHTWPDTNESLVTETPSIRNSYICKDFDKTKLGIHMTGQDVFKNASKAMVKAAKEVLTKTNTSLEEIKWFVPHQANLRIIEMVAKLLNFPMEKTYVNIQDWANTSSATMPICLSEMTEKGLLKKGDLILCDTFGGGFSFGAMLFRY